MLAVLLHRLSPLRDPAFERNSGNAGILVPWLAWVPESVWLRGSLGLAMLLALSLTWVFYQWSQAELPPSTRPVGLGEQLQRSRWVCMTAVLFGALWFTIYGMTNVVYPFSREGYGVQVAATVITALLAINFTGMIWFRQCVKALMPLSPVSTEALQRWGKVFAAVYWFGFSASVFTALAMVFLLYLFGQHIVD
jgi:hypothetical protein